MKHHQASSKKQTPHDTTQGENIKVAVRLRPFTAREEARNCERIIEIEKNTVTIRKPRNNLQQKQDLLGNSERKFTFDYAYWSHDGFKKTETGVNVSNASHPNGGRYVDQQKVFDDLGTFLLENALKGYNSALLAYGQTGSGKSYSVSGYGLNIGIIPRFARALFDTLELQLQKQEASSVAQNSNKRSKADVRPYEVYFSMIEIYNEIVRDLLATHLSDLLRNNQSTSSSSSLTMISRGLKVREHPKQGFFVENLTSHLCTSQKDIEMKIDEGQMNKTIVATNMNETSSRGHTIYEFTIKQAATKSNETITSVVQIVDLAGNERVAGQQANLSPTITSTQTHSSRYNDSKSPFATTADHRRQINSTKQGTTTRQLHSHNSSSSAHNINKSSTAAPYTVAQLQSQRFKESISINQSLSALGNCIQVLSQYSLQMETNAANSNNNGASNKACNFSSKLNQKLKIPYRDSVLTKLLNKCCLSGNSKVVIMATLSPADVHYDDTLSTLRFADRAKQIKTHATVNRNPLLNTKTLEVLSQENRRLKKIVEDGRQSLNRSDDSSQTSNFDESENMMENLTGVQNNSKERLKNSGATTNKSFSHHRTKLVDNLNPDAAQIGHVISTASEKIKNIDGRTNRRQQNAESWNRSIEENSDDYDLDVFDETIGDDSQVTNSKTVTSSTDSDDSFAALEGDDVSEKEKIEILNKLLSNTRILDKLNNDRQRGGANLATKQRTKGASNLTTTIKHSHNKASKESRQPRVPAARRLSMITGDLKNSHPYLSNLNQDEQLTGKISYLIKIGETIIGRDESCDIVLHGPEIRPKHAKIIRLTGNSNKSNNPLKEPMIFIEPIVQKDSEKKQNSHVASNRTNTDRKSSIGSNISALMVNGSKVEARRPLNHCDRVLIGTNSYFVFMDNVSQLNNDHSTMANFDMITFETARAEVARNMIESDKSGEQVLNEINNYQHRPGTGKYRADRGVDNNSGRRSVRSADINQKTVSNNLATSKEGADDATTVSKRDEEGRENRDIKLMSNANPDSLDAMYKDQLMIDTYDLTLPVAEANAIARELGIKVVYSMKILTGEEKPVSDTTSVSNYATDLESNAFEHTTSSSTTSSDNNTSGNINQHSTSSGDKESSARQDDSQQNVMRPKTLSSLDSPPEVYVKAYVEEFGFSFYWTNDKFRARHSKMFELYGVWDNGGKMGLIEYLIEQTRAFGKYIVDPFVDDPLHTFVLIGHSQIVLQPISHSIDIQHDFDILDLDDSVIGSIKIQATPCREIKLKSSTTTPVASNKQHNSNNTLNNNRQTASYKYEPYTEEELSDKFIDDPRKLLNKRLAIEIKIISCSKFPKKYCNIYCQYSLDRDQGFVKTSVIRMLNHHHQPIAESRESDSASTFNSSSNSTTNYSSSDNNKLILLHEQSIEAEEFFNYKHYIVFDSVTQDVLDFLQHGFLTVQVIGQYYHPTNKPLTVISTIIRSIDKFMNSQKQQQKNQLQNAAQQSSQHTTSFGASRNAYVDETQRNNGANSVATTTTTNSTTANDYYRNEANANDSVQQSGSSSVISASNLQKRRMVSGNDMDDEVETLNSNIVEDEELDNDDENDDNMEILKGGTQEGVIDMILTKRKLDRAENQLHYLRQTVNLAEQNNKKNISIRTMKRLLGFYGQGPEGSSFDDVTSDVATNKDQTASSSNKSGGGCHVM